MRPVLAILLGLTLLPIGCASQDRGPDQERVGQAAAAQEPRTGEIVSAAPVRRFAPGLIFDRRPGYYSASDFVYRSDWPSTDAYYRAPEYIFYREHFYDRQGPGLNDDYTFRQFDTYRYGAAVR